MHHSAGHQRQEAVMAPKGPRGPGLVLVSSSPNADAFAARVDALFAWVDSVLKRLGIKQAMTLDDLRKIIFDADDSNIELAIRDALHPPSGQRVAEHFIGMKEGSLKRLLKMRFSENKKEREDELRKASGAQQQ